MPKRVQLKRNFPYSEFDAWFNSDSKLSFNNFIKNYTLNLTLKTQDINNLKSTFSVIDSEKMIYSKEIILEEKHELENQIPHNVIVEGQSSEMKISTNFTNSNCTAGHTIKDDSETESFKDTSLLGKQIDTSEMAPKLYNVQVKLNSMDNTNLQPMQKENNKLNNFSGLNVSEGNKICQKAVETDNIWVEPKSKAILLEKICFHTSKEVHMQDRHDTSVNAIVPVNASGSHPCEEFSFDVNKSYEFNLKNDFLQQKDTNFNFLNTENSNYAAVQTTIEKSENETKTISHNGSEISLQSHDVEVKLSTSNHKKELQSLQKEYSKLNNCTELNVDNAICDEIYQNKTVESEKLCVEPKLETIPQENDSLHTTEKVDMLDKVDKFTTLNSMVPINISTSQVFDQLSCNVKNEKISDKCHLKNDCVLQQIDPNFNGSNIKIENSCPTISATKHTQHENSDSFYTVLSSKDNFSLALANGRDLKLDVHEAHASKVNFDDRLSKFESSVPKSVPPVTSSLNTKICDDKCLDLNVACIIKKEVSEEEFSTVACATDKIFTEPTNKDSSSKTYNICENQVQKSHYSTSSLDIKPMQMRAIDCSDSKHNSEFKNKVQQSADDLSSVSIASSNINHLSERDEKTNVCSNSENKIPTFDFYVLEKNDIEDPEWESVKKLKNNEERYKQVRECWETKNIPNPNKNLTYHSYRKQKLRAGKLDDRMIKQHKRQASVKSPYPPAKRTRKCTYTVDNQIHFIKSEQVSKTNSMHNEMYACINKLECNYNYQLSELKKQYNYYQYQGSRNQFVQDWNFIEMQYDQNLCNITSKFNNRIDTYTAQCRSKINALNKAHDEILTFCNFYEGLREDNPTVLTDSQLQEIEEIDDVYKQLRKYYN